MNNQLLKIEVFRKYLLNKKVKWTNHCLKRLAQRNILLKDVKNAINTGMIIEYYYNDYPYPSCLILGYNLNNKVLHVVCGITNEHVYMITAYYPDSNKWEENMKIRR